jgi:mlo protein
MVLLVGAKLQLIVTCLAREVRSKVEIHKTCTNIRLCKRKDLKKMASVTPRDELFWFSSPRLLLFVVHFILFQNAFELAFFFWTLFTYGYSSCLVGPTWMVIVRILVGFSIQLLCSASTLPLYALVTQLGTHMKFSIFQSESTGVALRVWAKTAKKKHNEANHVHTPLGTPHDSNHDSSHYSSMDSSTTDSSTSQDSRPHVHTPHDMGHMKPHIGILGLTKALHGHGHPVAILPGTKLHGMNGQAQGNGTPHYVHPHGQPPPQTHDEFHTVEIGEPPAAAAAATAEEDEDRKPQV